MGLHAVHDIIVYCKGYKVAHLAVALRHKSEGRGFDSRMSHWDFFYGVPEFYGPGVDSATNRNEYQEYLLAGKGGRCVGLTTLPLPCAKCLEILGASNSQIPKGLYRPV
jgi:hypothetical protein